MNLDECKIYVFVRQDIPIAQQLVQAAHAVFHMAHSWQNHDSHGVPFIVTIGMPDSAALLRVKKKLNSEQIEHFAFEDTDFDFPGDPISAIATAPLSKEQSSALSNYRLWRIENCRVSSEKEHLLSKQEAVGSSPSPGSIPSKE